jgi:Na+-transporting NADH:ubiquinone oxidoreductase subunit NqrC
LETIIFTLVLACGAIISAAAYLLAQVRSRDAFIQHLQQLLTAQSKELRDWQSKALMRSGGGMLTPKVVNTPTRKKQEITPKVITRQQLEYREADPMMSPVTIHADKISYSRVATAVEKAAEIIEAHK